MKNTTLVSISIIEPEIESPTENESTPLNLGGMFTMIALGITDHDVSKSDVF